MSFLNKLWRKILHPTLPWASVGSSVAIIGSGSWATAIAKMVVDNTGHIGWYMRKQSRIDQFRHLHHNPDYLTALQFDTGKIHFSSDINLIAKKYDILVFAVPSPFLKNHLKKLTTDISKKTIITAIKGIVPEEDMLVSDYMAKRYHIRPDHLLCIGGPTHAEEVAMNRYTFITLGCSNQKTAEQTAHLFQSEHTRVTTSSDINGIEYASVLKNIYAICMGVCNGLRYGDNFLAVLLTNCIKEMNRFLNVAATAKRNILDAPYLGDLTVTGYSNFSRNRTFGTMIGRGYSVESAQMEMKMIAEGYYGAKCITQINRTLQVDTPILNTVYNILYNKADPEHAIMALTERLR